MACKPTHHWTGGNNTPWCSAWLYFVPWIEPGGNSVDCTSTFIWVEGVPMFHSHWGTRRSNNQTTVIHTTATMLISDRWLICLDIQQHLRKKFIGWKLGELVNMGTRIFNEHMRITKTIRAQEVLRHRACFSKQPAAKAASIVQKLSLLISCSS